MREKPLGLQSMTVKVVCQILPLANSSESHRPSENVSLSTYTDSSQNEDTRKRAQLGMRNEFRPPHRCGQFRFDSITVPCNGLRGTATLVEAKIFAPRMEGHLAGSHTLQAKLVTMMEWNSIAPSRLWKILKRSRHQHQRMPRKAQDIHWSCEELHMVFAKIQRNSYNVSLSRESR